MSKGQISLGIVLTSGFILLTAFYFFGPDTISESLREPMLLITGCWITNLTTIVNYFFGSSKGSADKTAMLKNPPQA